MNKAIYCVRMASVRDQQYSGRITVGDRLNEVTVD